MKDAFIAPGLGHARFVGAGRAAAWCGGAKGAFGTVAVLRKARPGRWGHQRAVRGIGRVANGPFAARRLASAAGHVARSVPEAALFNALAMSRTRPLRRRRRCAPGPRIRLPPAAASAETDNEIIDAFRLTALNGAFRAVGQPRVAVTACGENFTIRDLGVPGQ